MTLFKKFYPYSYEISAYELDYQKLYNQGFRGILFDIDNTLVEHGKPATKRSCELFEHLRSIGFKTCVISNNKEPRVAPFAKAVGTQYVFDAKKPSAKNYFHCLNIILS